MSYKNLRFSYRCVCKTGGQRREEFGLLSQQEKTWACFFLSKENDDIQVFGKIECQYFRKSWTFGRKMREIIKQGGKVVCIYEACCVKLCILLVTCAFNKVCYW